MYSRAEAAELQKSSRITQNPTQISPTRLGTVINQTIYDGSAHPIIDQSES
jgi:hypothetical protein